MLHPPWSSLSKLDFHPLCKLSFCSDYPTSLLGLHLHFPTCDYLYPRVCCRVVEAEVVFSVQGWSRSLDLLLTWFFVRLIDFGCKKHFFPMSQSIITCGENLRDVLLKLNPLRMQWQSLTEVQRQDSCWGSGDSLQSSFLSEGTKLLLRGLLFSETRDKLSEQEPPRHLF